MAKWQVNGINTARSVSVKAVEYTKLYWRLLSGSWMNGWVVDWRTVKKGNQFSGRSLRESSLCR